MGRSYCGPYVEERNRLKGITLSNGHNAGCFQAFWSRCMTKQLSVEDVVKEFDKSVYSKKKINKRGMSSRGKKAKREAVTKKSSSSTEKVEMMFRDDYKRLARVIVSRGHNRMSFWNTWKRWDVEGIGLEERERRLSNSHFHYNVIEGRKLMTKGFIPSIDKEADPLSHLYMKYASQAFDNGWDVTQRGNIQVIMEFRTSWTEEVVKQNLSEEEREDWFIKSKYSKERIRAIRKVTILTEEQEKAKEWAHNLLYQNGYTDELKPHLLLKRCLLDIARFIRNWKSLDEFKSVVTQKFGCPNYKNEAIINQILDDTEDKWSVLFRDELDEDLFRNCKKRLDFTSLVADAIGHYEVAVYLVKSLYQDEIDRSNGVVSDASGEPSQFGENGASGH